MFTDGTWTVHEGLDYIAVLRGDETTDQGIRVDNMEDALLIAESKNLFEACKMARERLTGAIGMDRKCDDKITSARDLLTVVIGPLERKLAAAPPQE
jgi:hypothetical protein